MATPYVAYSATAGQRDFDVPFPYINRSHVKVRVNGIEATPSSWLSDTRLRLSFGTAGGDFVEVIRDTPIEVALVKFQDGNVLTSEDLNIAILQTLYKQQELAAAYEREIESGKSRIAAAGGVSVPADDLFNSIVAELAENATVANFQQRIADIDLNATNILSQANDIADRRTEIAAVELRADTLESTATSLQTSADGLRTDLNSLTAVVDSLAGGDPGTGVATLIQQEENARIAGDQALVDTIDLIGAKSGDNLSFIANLNTLKVSPTESLAQRFTALSAADDANAASIASEATARADAISAEATRIDLLTSRVGTAEADIITEQTTRANAISAEAAQRALLAARVTDAEADIVTEQTARANGDAAEAAQRALLTARVDQAEADIFTEQSVRASADNALAEDISLLGAANVGGTAFVLNQTTVQVSPGETLGTRLSAINTDLGDLSADIASEETARIAADNAEASARSALAARVTDAESDIVSNAAAIVSESNARASAISAEASARTALAARVTTAEGDINANEAAILSEQTARANGDSALASDLALLGASNAGGTAWVLDENTVQVTPGTTLGTRLSGIDTSLSNNAASIVSEQTARINGDNANASAITALTTTVNGNTASVNTLQSSVNGLEAKYGVTLDVNGYVTGFAQNNNGTTGSFVIVADEFKIVDPNGGAGQTPVVPFQISNGDVKINGNLVVAGSITSSQLAANSVTKGNSAYTSGTIAIPGGGSWTTVQSCALTTSGGEVKIDFCGCYERFGGGATSVAYRIRRGTTTVREGTLVQAYGETLVNVQDSETFRTIGTASIPYPTTGTYSLVAVDTAAPSGTHTYTVEISSLQSGGIMNSRQMALLELKR